MGAITITLTRTCDGNGHFDFATSGAKAVTLTDVQAVDALSAMTDEEARAWLKGCIKLAKVGRTNAQVKTLFEGGVTVTI